MKCHYLFPLTFLSVLCLTFGCKHDYPIELTFHKKPSHLITIEDALKNLDEYNAYSTENRLKSNTPFKVSTIYKNNSLLKSNINNNAPLLYIVNYDNNNGYAILSADKRISASVIAVAENGNFPEESFHSLNNRTLYNGYPLNGPGIYNDDSLGLHINPNTFDPYNDELDDYYVGDLILEFPDDTLKKCIPFLAELIENYALNEIDTYDWTLVDSSKKHLFDDGLETKTSYEVTYNLIVPPMFADFDDWTQWKPFNIFSPTIKKEKAPCGCVDLATAYVITYWAYPELFTINGIRINWENIRKKKNLITDAQSISALTRDIGISCLSIYSAEGTFTFPSLAAKYLKDIYKNVKYQNYDNYEVRTTLNKGCPIIICSVPGIKLNRAHAWNIDGYKYKNVTIVTNYYKNGIYQKTIRTSAAPEMMVHCNFGWSGSCNGYYTSGIFDLNKGELDDSEGERKNTIYNNYLKIITYDAPK